MAWYRVTLRSERIVEADSELESLERGLSETRWISPLIRKHWDISLGDLETEELTVEEAKHAAPWLF